MKLTAIFLLSFCLQVSANGFSQRVTITGKNITLQKVFRQIHKQTGYQFFYEDEMLNKAGRININVKNEPLDKALEDCFRGLPISYTVENNTITVRAKTSASESGITEIPHFREIHGTVKDSSGNPLAGVSIVVRGTSRGTSTGADGSFSIEANTGETLVFTFVGYKSVSRVIGESGDVNITMRIEETLGQEVVVVGFGTQRRTQVTGAIANVSEADIAGIPHDGRVEAALEGRTPGVIVNANSGQPGSDFTVRVRGISTINSGNDPLWVVDGIVVQTSNLNYLNQSDIESIDVLKDAASAAIYGTRAANGVVLITTKKGKAGKLTVGYDGYAGIQSVARKFPVTDATQYATLMNEKALSQGEAIPYADPQSLGKGTNWQDEIFQNTMRTNHEISLRGGTQNANLYISAGYQKQEGIVMPDVSQYERYSLRINHNEKFLKIFKFGQELAYSRNNSRGVGINTEFGNAMSDALNLDPLTPLIATQGMLGGSQYQSPYIVLSPNGMPYGISSVVSQEIVNPIAQEQTMLGNNGYSDNIIGNTYFEIDPMKGLTLRSQIGINKNYWGNWAFTPLYYLNSNTQNTVRNSLNRGSGIGLEWNWDNTISYDKTIGEHSFGVMVGHSVSEDGIGNTTNITYLNLPVDNYKDANFNWPTVQANVNAGTSDFTLHRVLSFFGRINYNYAQKYLLTAILRYDGSSRFGANNKWGRFPSISVGWVPTLENFWKNHLPVAINFLKIRASYGITGNDNFSNFQYAATIAGGNNYVFGPDGIPALGNSPTTLANPDLKWEQTAQTDIGLDARFLEDFNFTFDYFYKKTKNLLLQPPIPQYTGVPNRPWANVGDMLNEGVEFSLGYDKKINEWSFGASANFATLKNRITYIGSGTPYLLDGTASFQNIVSGGIGGRVNRDVVGYPAFAFWGYKTNGVFQTPQDVQNYVNSHGQLLQPDAQPGDFKWTDVNGDGVIGPDDATYLGSPLPTYTYGLSVNVGYGNERTGNFDLTVFIQGQGGNKIFQGYRRLDVDKANFPLDWLNRWTGPGSTNSYPRIVSTNDNNGNYSNMSDFYLQDGAFLRLKNVQLGYTLPSGIASRISASKLRIYVASENLLTLTGYDGFDPEIGGGVFGIDKGYYPQARTFMVGLNLAF